MRNKFITLAREIHNSLEKIDEINTLLGELKARDPDSSYWPRVCDIAVKLTTGDCIFMLKKEGERLSADLENKKNELTAMTAKL